MNEEWALPDEEELEKFVEELRQKTQKDYEDHFNNIPEGECESCKL